MLPDYFNPRSGAGWYLKKEQGLYYWHMFDPGHGGAQSRVQISEDSYRYAIETQPALDDIALYLVKMNNGEYLRYEPC